MPDPSRAPGLLFPKPTPAGVVTAAKKQARVSRDEAESRKVRQRAAGRCEIRVQGEGRCRRAVAHVHHLIGGQMRGRSASALKDHKVAVCKTCHADLHAHRLERTRYGVPHWTDGYRRVR